MNCADFADVAAELALGALTGRERADALAHLGHCDACAARVGQLTTADEELLGLLPSREPPPGFETRVMERLRLTVPGPQPGSTRLSHRACRMLAAAAATVVVAAAALAGWGLHAVTPSPRPALSSAVLLASGHQNAGEVFLYDGEPRWMYMSVHLDTGTRTGTVICQLLSADGRVTTVGSFWLTHGYGSWGSPGWVGDGTPAGARLIAADGTVLATASFRNAPAAPPPAERERPRLGKST
jgi:anti-sigma-K factor RskA